MHDLAGRWIRRTHGCSLCGREEEPIMAGCYSLADKKLILPVAKLLRHTHIGLIRQCRVDVGTFAQIEVAVLGGGALAGLTAGCGEHSLGLEPEPTPGWQQGRGLRLDPVDDGDVDIGFAGPGQVLHRLEDGAILDDVVQAADAGLVVADVLRADQASTAG